MKKLLTVCIPTYKRENSLRRCIESVVTQIEDSSLSQYVGIFVADDASPDSTVAVLKQYQSFDFFAAVTRIHNLGMSVNIKEMLQVVSQKSEYQLIVTDDDYLQPGVLNEIVDFLQGNNKVSAIWTPRYSYTDDGELHCVVCDPFDQSTLIHPSAGNAGKHMGNGFVLSGLILRGENIDYDLWEEYAENAYFPVLIFGDLIYRQGAYFWKKNIVHHTVLNICHWERWGKNDVVIEMRLFLDFVHAYRILAKEKISSQRFYLASFPSIYHAVMHLLTSEKLKAKRPDILDAIEGLHRKRATYFGFPYTQLLTFVLALGASLAAVKLLTLRVLSLVSLKKSKRERFIQKSRAQSELLQNIPLVFSLISS